MISLNLSSVFLLNIFDLMEPVYSYFLCCLGAIISGVVVGKEREKAQKAAGLRTFAMVALGACVYSLISRLLMDQEGYLDTARIPAQVVSGVGFLGAGAVFRSGRFINGLTTAAGIWATAAVGLVFGLGYVVFGLSITFMIFLLLWIHSFFERRTLYTQTWSTYEIHVDARDGKGPIFLREIIWEWGHEFQSHKPTPEEAGKEVWRVKLSPLHRRHQRFLSELARQVYVMKMVELKDEN